MKVLPELLQAAMYTSELDREGLLRAYLRTFPALMGLTWSESLVEGLDIGVYVLRVLADRAVELSFGCA